MLICMARGRWHSICLAENHGTKSIWVWLDSLKSNLLSVILLDVVVIFAFASFLLLLLESNAWDGLVSLSFLYSSFFKSNENLHSFVGSFIGCCLSVCTSKSSRHLVGGGIIMILSNFASSSFFPSHSIMGSLAILCSLTIIQKLYHEGYLGVVYTFDSTKTACN